MDELGEGAKRLSVRSVGSAGYISQSTLNRALKGRRVDRATREAIASLIGVTLGELEGVETVASSQTISDGLPSMPGTWDGLSNSAMERIKRALARDPKAPPPFDTVTARRVLSHRFAVEAFEMLLATNVFDMRNLQRGFGDNGQPSVGVDVCNRLVEAAQFSRQSRDGLPFAGFLGGDTAIRIICPGSLFASLVVFTHLTLVEGLSLSVDVDGDYSAAPLRSRLNGQIDHEVVVLPLVSAISYLNRHDRMYEPLMIMPRGSHRLVTMPETGKEWGAATATSILLPGDGTAKSYVSDLAQLGLLPTNGIDKIECSISDIPELLKDEPGRVAAVMWFPLNLLSEVLDGGRFVDSDGLESASKETVLFVRKDLLRDRLFQEELIFWITRASASLRRDFSVVELLVETLFANPSYIRSLATAMQR